MPWTAASQSLLSFIILSLLKLKIMSIEWMRSFNHFILCHPLLLSSNSPSIRVFSSKSAFCIRWPKYWRFSFTISTSSEYSGLVSFTTDLFDVLTVQGTLKSLLSSTIVRKHQFVDMQSSLWPKCHIGT